MTATYRPSMNWRHPIAQYAGFTLIELMVTVAIVAILAAIAYPSYHNYVIRGQIVSATNGLSAMSANMERYFQDNRQYTSYTSSGTTYYPPCANAGGTAITSGNFTLTCSILTATAYTLQASGAGVVAGFVYTVDNTGTQSTVISGVRGWTTTCATTWIISQTTPCN